MRRVAVAVAVAAAGALAAAGAGSAQQPPPTVTITASETTVAMDPGGPLPSGPTRFEVVKSGGEEVSISIGALREGVTRDEFIEAVRRNPDEGLELVHLDGGVDLSPREQRRAVTFTLRPNADYVVLNSSPERPSEWQVIDFKAQERSNGATAPEADASVRMIDLRFRGDRTLPRNGVVRVENAGWAPHFAFAFPLRRDVRTRAVARALRRGRERRFGRLVNFRGAIAPQALVTRGAVNFNELRFPRRGRHVMVCFFDGHHRQGMFRFIRVR